MIVLRNRIAISQICAPNYEAFAIHNKYSETRRYPCVVTILSSFQTSRLLAKSRKGIRRMWRDS